MKWGLSAISYERVEQTAFIGVAGLAKLQSKRVAVLGLGNIGGQVARHLAMLGVKLTLVDCGFVERQNLATQGYETGDLGAAKVSATERRLKAINPDCSVTPIFSEFGRLGAAALQVADLVLCCFDSLADRLLVNERCWRLGTPWIDAAIDGTGRLLYGRVVLYDPGSPEGPCYLCRWDQPGLQEALRLERERAGQAGTGTKGCADWRFELTRGELSPPTLSISSLGGVIGGIQSLLAIDFLLARTERSVASTEITVDFGHHPYSMRVYQLRRNRHCLFDHQVFRLVAAGEDSAANFTVGRLFSIAEKQLGVPVTLQFHGRELITRLRCPSCANHLEPFKLAEVIQEEELICSCGATRRAGGLDRLRSFTREQARPFLERTCGELGLPPNDVVSATNGSENVDILVG
ncbi:MAG: ThiF family adenylyltransferase [Acidobacteria bacterium]|nr:ThiF family adenylyltransferase [Acidobacteriota bacterium]MCI0721413.1 ThiF family adenylyltransferase [Acidobacteriota bacterium]